MSDGRCDPYTTNKICGSDKTAVPETTCLSPAVAAPELLMIPEPDSAEVAGSDSPGRKSNRVIQRGVDCFLGVWHTDYHMQERSPDVLGEQRQVQQVLRDVD